MGAIAVQCLWLAKNEPMQLASLMGDPPRSAASPADPSRYSLYCLILVAATFAICLIRLCGFVQENAVNLLFDDQWDLLNPLFNGQGPWSCFFFQDGPQRQGLGGLIYWCLYWATGWNVRAEVWAEVIVLALATIAAIALAARLRGRLAWSDAAFPLLLLSPIHWGTMTLLPMMAYGILPLLLVLLLASAWTVRNFALRVALVGILGGLALFTNYGLCGTVAAIGLALLLWLRPRKEEAKTEKRQAVLILLCLAGAVALFAHGYRWEPGVPGWRFPVPNWWDYPRFCALMFASLLGLRSLSVAAVTAGAVLLSLVLCAFVGAAATIWRRQATARAKTVWILTGTSLVYSALVAVGRLPMNIEAAFLWRYMTLMTAGICGLAIAAEGWVISSPPVLRRCFMIGWIVLAGTIWCNFLPERYGATVAMGKRLWIASYLRTRDLGMANKEANFWVYFQAPDSSRIAERLQWLEQRHLSF
ncbi:MAG TPA: hypothetical protein VNW23_08315, partial [Opitutaceae bacterium]|nr:hypothetical protein [Opitutaceae bacterium]